MLHALRVCLMESTTGAKVPTECLARGAHVHTLMLVPWTSWQGHNTGMALQLHLATWLKELQYWVHGRTGPNPAQCCLNAHALRRVLCNSSLIGCGEGAQLLAALADCVDGDIMVYSGILCTSTQSAEVCDSGARRFAGDGEYAGICLGE